MAASMQHSLRRHADLTGSSNSTKQQPASSSRPFRAVRPAAPSALRQQQRLALQPVQALSSSVTGQPLLVQQQQLQQYQPHQQLWQQQGALSCRQQQQQQQRRGRLLLVFAVAPSASDGSAAADGGDGADSDSVLDPNIPAVDQDFDLLGAEVKKLQEQLGDELKGCSVYLIGMMGSGKSTTGKMLANTLKYAFFDTDNMIERAHAGETVAEIFKKYGEDYFRQCEEQVLKELAPYKSLVIATGGGAVTRPKNWSYMHNGIVAWLNGEPSLLARRVVAEGLEKRPLLFGEGVSESEAYEISLSKLNKLLEDRTKYYENADVTVDLKGYGKDEAAGAPTAVVMHRLMDAIAQKIQSTKEEREARRQFTIERSGEVPSMRKQQSPAAQQQPAAEE